jgi:hypothetical protein
MLSSSATLVCTYILCTTQSEYGLTEERAAALPQFMRSSYLFPVTEPIAITLLAAVRARAVEQHGSEAALLQHLDARRDAARDSDEEDNMRLFMPGVFQQRQCFVTGFQSIGECKCAHLRIYRVLTV